MTRAPVGFDLDLTLIDSRRAILASFAAVAADTGVPIEATAVESRLGIKLEAELAYWFAAGDIAAAMGIYRSHYRRLAGPLTHPLPGAREALAAVRAAGALAVVITAKLEAAARLSLDGVRPAEGGGARAARRGRLRRRRPRGHGRRGLGGGVAGGRPHRFIQRR